MNNRKPTCPDGLAAFLKGYGENNVQGLAFIARYPQWRELAAAESARRATAILQSLSLPEVEAIAVGEIDFRLMAEQRLIILKAKSS